ncbi:MAG: hypothetical protein GWN00_01330 [Aliifodinibius sp.]|nr:hypothetical protein [Fodinibius sp.]NIV09974.1 hypothetical protein [Fodinibius sp.]NIY23504.1 hypothetical protein [Fodinibius sp.]
MAVIGDKEYIVIDVTRNDGGAQVIETETQTVITEEVTNYQVIEHGQRGLDAQPGATKTTLLTITELAPAGYSFYVNSSGTKYIKEGDDGSLGGDADAFNNNEIVQVYVNGAMLVKAVEVIWESSVSFRLSIVLDPGDMLEILS